MKTHVVPQRKAEIWAGTRLPIDLLLEPPQDLVVDCWVESSSGIVRQCQVVPGESPLEGFAARLESAIERPLSGMKAYRPGGILVDRPELAEAIQDLCARHRIEIQVRPAVAEKLQELVSKLERDLGGGPGFGYMLGEEIEPALVGELFDRAARVLDRRPWFLVPSPLLLEIAGLLHLPIYLSVLGEGSDVELVLHLSPKDAHQFSAAGGTSVPGLHLTLFPPGQARPGLKAEMDQYGWQAHPLGIPLLLSGFRPEQSNPTALELKIMNLVLEALEQFEINLDLNVVRLSQGTEAQLRLVPIVEPEILESRPMEAGDVLETLDKLWAEGEVDEAVKIAVLFLSRPGNESRPIAYRLPLYLCVKGDLQWASGYWQLHTHGCAPEWYYLGAYLDLQRGYASSALRRLKKGIKHSPEVGHRLLNQDESDDYARLWGPMWRDHPESLAMLTEVLGKRSAAQPPGSSATARKGSRRSGKRKV